MDIFFSLQHALLLQRRKVVIEERSPVGLHERTPMGLIMLLLVLSHVLRFAVLRPSSSQECPFRIVPLRRYV